MAIQMPNSMFIHVPKTGSRWVWRQLLEYVDGAEYLWGDDAAAHWCPQTDLQVIAGVRHPLTWLFSYYLHRNRHGWVPRPGWIVDGQMAPVDKLFQKPMSANQFFNEVLGHPGIVSEHLRFWLDRYDTPLCIRMEHLAYDLVAALETVGESFNREGIFREKDKKIGKTDYTTSVPPELVHQLWENEKEFFGQWYEEYPKE